KPYGSKGGAAGGEHVVDDEDRVAGLEGVEVNLELSRPVFELILEGFGMPRELAGLAHGHQTGAQAVGHGRGDDEPARLDGDDLVDVTAGDVVGDGVDSEPEGIDGPEQRRQVLEDDAGRRNIRDIME